MKSSQSTRTYNLCFDTKGGLSLSLRHSHAIPYDVVNVQDAMVDMALCMRQCGKCRNLVTVKIDFDEGDYSGRRIDGAIARAVILELYESIIADFSEEDSDIAIILHVSGADIAVICRHSLVGSRPSDIELF